MILQTCLVYYRYTSIYSGIFYGLNDPIMTQWNKFINRTLFLEQCSPLFTVHWVHYLRKEGPNWNFFANSHFLENLYILLFNNKIKIFPPVKISWHHILNRRVISRKLFHIFSANFLEVLKFHLKWMPESA